MPINKPFRTAAELFQTYGEHQGFNFTTVSDDAEDALIIVMEEGNKISLYIDLADALIEFDDDATETSMLITENGSYDENNIFITSRISIKNAKAGKKTRISGMLWGR